MGLGPVGRPHSFEGINSQRMLHALNAPCLGFLLQLPIRIIWEVFKMTDGVLHPQTTILACLGPTFYWESTKLNKMYFKNVCEHTNHGGNLEGQDPDEGNQESWSDIWGNFFPSRGLTASFKISAWEIEKLGVSVVSQGWGLGSVVKLEFEAHQVEYAVLLPWICIWDLKIDTLRIRIA